MVDHRSPMLNNMVQLGQQQFMSTTAAQNKEDEKFAIVPIDALVSNKTMMMQ